MIRRSQHHAPFPDLTHELEERIGVFAHVAAQATREEISWPVSPSSRYRDGVIEGKISARKGRLTVPTTVPVVLKFGGESRFTALSCSPSDSRLAESAQVDHPSFGSVLRSSAQDLFSVFCVVAALIGVAAISRLCPIFARIRPNMISVGLSPFALTDPDVISVGCPPSPVGFCSLIYNRSPSDSRALPARRLYVTTSLIPNHSELLDDIRCLAVGAFSVGQHVRIHMRII